MYVCTCVCIHVHVCDVYIVCHEYIDTCIHLFVVHLDIILLVVSDGDDRDSTKGLKSLFENPGVIEVHELHEVFVHTRTTVLSTTSSDIPLTLERKNRVCCFVGKKIVTLKRREMTCLPQGGHNRNGKGKGICLRVEFLLKTDDGYPKETWGYFIHPGNPWESPPV